MADNGMIIEFGTRSSAGQSMADMREALTVFEAWKNDDRIEDYRWYINVTGNRARRIAVIVLETSSAQLENLVTTPDFAMTTDLLARKFENYTQNRLIFGDRLFALVDQMDQSD